MLLYSIEALLGVKSSEGVKAPHAFTKVPIRDNHIGKNLIKLPRTRAALLVFIMHEIRDRYEKGLETKRSL